MNEVNILNIGGTDYNVDDQYVRDAIAHSENGLDPQSNLPISSRHYDQGDYLIGQDRLYYEVTADIDQGDVMAVGTNLRQTIVADELVRLKNQSSESVASSIAYTESTATASKPYNVGDYLFWTYGLDAGLYKAKTAIVLNEAFIVDTNIEDAGTITDMIKDSLKEYYNGNQQWDTTPTDSSTKPVTSGGIYTSLTGKQSTYSADSTAWDTAPTDSSTKPVTSGGIKTELDKKLPTYANGTGSWNTAPTASSTKPVTSGGIYTAFKNEFKEVSNTTTVTIDLGGMIAINISPPSGYTFFAIKSYETNNWTVPVNKIQVDNNGVVRIVAYKLLSGSDSVTLKGTAIFRKTYS